MTDYILGVDVGGSRLRLILSNKKAENIDDVTIVLEEGITTERLNEKFIKEAEQLLKAHSFKPSDVIGVTIGSAGVPDQENKILTESRYYRPISSETNIGVKIGDLPFKSDFGTISEFKYHFHTEKDSFGNKLKLEWPIPLLALTEQCSSNDYAYSYILNQSFIFTRKGEFRFILKLPVLLLYLAKCLSNCDCFLNWSCIYWVGFCSSHPNALSILITSIAISVTTRPREQILQIRVLLYLSDEYKLTIFSSVQ